MILSTGLSDLAYFLNGSLDASVRAEHGARLKQMYFDELTSSPNVKCLDGSPYVVLDKQIVPMRHVSRNRTTTAPPQTSRRWCRGAATQCAESYMRCGVVLD